MVAVNAWHGGANRMQYQLVSSRVSSNPMRANQRRILMRIAMIDWLVV